MDGAVPSARSGHVMSKINNDHAILFDGLQFCHRDKCDFKQSL